MPAVLEGAAPSCDESKTRLRVMHVSPFVKGLNALLPPKREDPVAFVSHVAWPTFDGKRGIHRARHGERPIIVLSREGAMRGRRKDRAGPIERTQRIVGQWHDDVWWPRLLLIRRVKRDVHGHISRPHELKSIE